MTDMLSLRQELLEIYMENWVATASTQCDRALTSDEASDATRLFDAILAVQCIRNARRAADTLLASRGDHWLPAETIQRFDDEHVHVKTMRDVMEHFDEYIEGRGRLQKKLSKESTHERRPFRIAFEKDTGVLRIDLTDRDKFQVDLRALRNDIAYLMIDLKVDFDALEDEPYLFEESDEED